MYKCTYCSLCTSDLRIFCSHVKKHQHIANHRFACGDEQCPASFKTFVTFRSHMHRKHRRKPDNKKQSQFRGTLACNIEGCSFVADNFSALCAHLRSHIRDGKKVYCPYDNCCKYFRVRSSFSAHISRKHTQVATAQMSGPPEMTSGTPERDLCFSATDHEEEEYAEHESFLHNLAQFYLKMHAKMQLPASTIQCIIEGFQHVHTSSLADFFDKLKAKLLELNIPQTKIDQIIHSLSKEDLFTLYNEGPLRSDKTRKTFYKQNFDYTEPKQIYLGTDIAGKERFCQYVPIKETLQTLLRQSSVKVQCSQARCHNNDDMVLEDVLDGRHVTENSLLKSTSSLSLILYQDAFEVTNPLGSGKKKHKILAVYMSLGELQPHNRSLVDPMQLVLLCREKDFKTFGLEKVFSSIITDLKDLEDAGIDTDDGIRKASLISICGDNLGSHCIGGFCENFSTNIHFCRYCLINRSDFQKTPLKLGPKRTVEVHKETVKQLSTTGQDVVQGVKFDSPFNSLKHFHVCTGLPPCLGHDLFEGVVSYDLALYIYHLVKQEKQFTYAQLNRSITQFKYLGNDGLNKPCEVKADGKRLCGSAAQNWCMLRLLPLLVGSRIKSPMDSQVWQLCLQLKEMVELICAPKIHHNQVAYLKTITEEYIHLRCSLFPNHPLKPKHHYLLHYSDLILHFGPLIRLWTLRFESKHSYFKECARKLHNFVHLCKTLAERHQLLQGYLCSGSVFPPTVQAVGEVNEYDEQLYCGRVQEAVRAAGFSKETMSEVSAVVYKGTKYRKGFVVALNAKDQDFIFGKISMIFISHTQVHFVVDMLQSVLLSDLGLHCLGNSEERFLCVHADKMDTERLQCEIKKALPELEDEILRTLVAHLIDVIGVRKREDLIFVGSEDITPFLTPIQSRKLIHAFKNANGEVASTSSEGQEPTVSIPVLLLPEGFSPSPTQISLQTSSNQNKSWISSFQVPWDKMPARLLQAVEKSCLAHPEDRRVLIRVVVDAMQAHCKNPSKAACTEVARVIVCKYPGTFADKTAEGEQLGCGYYSLFRQLKTRVEHVNRDNVSHRIRQPRKRPTDDNSGDDAAIKRGRTDVDCYGCKKWQPNNLPPGETEESLEDKRKSLITVFNSEGPTAVERIDVENNMELTYIYQRHMINTWPPPSLCEVEEQWPFLFTKRGLCSHFNMLTGIDIDTRLHEAFLTKGRRIVNFFMNQRLKWNQDIQALLRELEHESINNLQPIAAILLLMKHFQEKEDHIFILTDPTSTKLSLEQEVTLPTTPRLIMLGSSLMSATHWMVSIEGKVCYESNQLHDFASAFAIFFSSFYAFNLEYQESASTTLEMVQRFFVRINPEEGTKCTAKVGTSRKTGGVVQRKVTAISSRVTTFLQRLTEFEWKTSN